MLKTTCVTLQSPNIREACRGKKSLQQYSLNSISLPDAGSIFMVRRYNAALLKQPAAAPI